MRRALSIVLAVGCGGGGSEDPLANEADVVAWANSSSALGVYELIREPLGIADGELSYPDPGCPTVADDGTTVTIAGDCADVDGNAWTGTVTVVRSSSGGASIDLDGFGNDVVLGPVVTTGTATTTDPVANRRGFQISAVIGGGVTTTLTYTGTVAGSYNTPTTWNGFGTAKEGEISNGNTIEVETVDQLRDDDACPGESFSGATTLTSAAHIVVISYDGDTACDDEHAARWSRDGEDQGTIEGITCQSGSGDAGLIVIAMCGLLLRRSRR